MSLDESSQQNVSPQLAQSAHRRFGENTSNGRSSTSHHVRETITRNTENRGCLEIAPTNISGFLSGSERMEVVPITAEEPWGEVLERLLGMWKDQAQREATKHEKAGYRIKRKFKILGFIVLISATLNLIFSTLFPCSEDNVFRYILTFEAGLNVFWSTLFTQMDLQEKYTTHFEYQMKFQDLVYDIEFVLHRDADFRPAADQFITEIKERKKMLDTAPEFPSAKYFFF